MLSSPFFAMYDVSPLMTSFAIASGPVSGLTQPFIGLMSDACASPWGRRRPFLLVGLAMTLVGMILFATARYFGFLSVVHSETIILSVAIFALWLFTIGLNVMQVSGLSLIVDEVDATEIPVAMTVFSILQSLSSALGCILAFVDFHSFLPLGVENYEAVFFLGIILVCVFGLPSLFISETPFIPPEKQPPLMTRVKEFFVRIWNMKRLVAMILLLVGLMSAMQSPWLSYYTSYVGIDVYHGDPGLPSGVDRYEEGVRFGSLVMFLWQIGVFILSCFVPKLITLIGFQALFCLAFLYGGTGFGFLLWSRLATPTCALLLGVMTSLFQAVFYIVPYVIISLSVESDEVGLYMGYVAVATVIFQVGSNTLAGYLMDNSFINDYLGLLGIISPGIAYGVIYIIFALPVVMLLQIPDEFEMPPKEHHVEREKRLSRRDSLHAVADHLPLVLDGSLHEELTMDASISMDTSFSFDR